MSTVFCRGCAKEIHDTAPYCPNCGAPQPGATTVQGGISPWLAITSIVLAILAIICAVKVESFDHDQIVGGAALAVLALAAGAINLHQKKTGKGIAIAAVVLAAVSFFILTGS